MQQGIGNEKAETTLWPAAAALWGRWGGRRRRWRRRLGGLGFEKGTNQFVTHHGLDFRGDLVRGLDRRAAIGPESWVSGLES